MIEEQRLKTVMQKVRDKGHTAIAEVELRLMATLTISRNPNMSDDEIASTLADVLGVLGGSTSGSDVAFEKGSEEHDEKLNDKSIYDKYSEGAWKTNEL